MRQLTDLRDYDARGCGRNHVAFGPLDYRKRDLEISERLSTLRTTAPQKFGYLNSNWRVAKTGLDNRDTTFAEAADSHAYIAKPSVDTRTLGDTLQILADLGVLDAATDRNAATLYDLRSYDADALAMLGQVLDNG